MGLNESPPHPLIAERDRFRAERDTLLAQRKELLEAVEFYADPETYFAIGFWPDPPCGEFADDFSDVDDYPRPGKRAREVLAHIQESGK